MTAPAEPAARDWLLAIDTATSRIVVAAGTADGRRLGGIELAAGHRHGEQLLPAIERLLGETGLSRDALLGIVVGTGPGAFTGLRVGLATAKTLAHAMCRPIVGVSTAAALARASGGSGEGPGQPAAVVLLPAGPHDQVVVRPGAAPELLPGGTEAPIGPGEVVVAVDLEDRATADAAARGRTALDGLGAALLAAGAARLAMGAGDDPETLVPDYVTLPRGVRAASGEIEWSRDRR